MPESMTQLIGIDLGGTAIKLGRFDRQGELLAELQVPTPQPAMPGAVAVALAEAVQSGKSSPESEGFFAKVKDFWDGLGR
jgi:glucokinase